MPAVRSAADDVWVRAQVAKRNAHVRRLAERAGIDAPASSKHYAVINAQAMPLER